LHRFALPSLVLASVALLLTLPILPDSLELLGASGAQPAEPVPPDQFGSWVPASFIGVPALVLALVARSQGQALSPGGSSVGGSPLQPSLSLRQERSLGRCHCVRGLVRLATDRELIFAPRTRTPIWALSSGDAALQDAADAYLKAHPIPPHASLADMSRSDIDRLQMATGEGDSAMYAGIAALNNSPIPFC
jgi:hypothetical protein